MVLATIETMEEMEPLRRLSRDLRQASVTLTPPQARYLVDLYYQVQEYRKRAANQDRAMGESGEPHQLIEWVFGNFETLENDIKRALDRYSDSQMTGLWSKRIVGIGPVIAAGLLAHIDIDQAPTVGHIWRFAGLDSTVEWLGTERAKVLVKDVLGARKQPSFEDIAILGQRLNRRPENVRAWDSATRSLIADPGQMTQASLAAGLARRPWNAKLKTLCWKIGQSFMKVQNNDNDFYGKLYVQRKVEEWARNKAGLFAGQAEAGLAKLRPGGDQEARYWYGGYLTLEAVAVFEATPPEKRMGLAKKLAGEPGCGVPMLPPAHIDARARRWTVKLFLSHWHEVAYTCRFGCRPPKPYVLDILGHADVIQIPNWPM